jgi:hypothetical protein
MQRGALEDYGERFCSALFGPQRDIVFPVKGGGGGLIWVTTALTARIFTEKK